MNKSKWLFLVLVLIAPWPLYAGNAEIVHVDVKPMGNDLYEFNVTVAHEDAGWGHFVDKWVVMAPDGSLLGSRPIVQPHKGQKTFTRNLVGVMIPSEIKEVSVRAHDSVHGDGKTVTVQMPR